MKNIWDAHIDDLPGIADVVAKSLLDKGAFVLWLQGDLGAGKTTFAGYLLRSLGLPKNVPVLSPTFTYLTEYKTTSGLIAHMDLYRLVDGDTESLESLLSGREFRGLIVEWPERAPLSPLIEPTHELSISMVDQDDRRVFVFFRR